MDSDSALENEEFVDPLIGTMVGRFRVERKIGQGGMGAVYSLLQPAIQKRMALKLLHEQYVARQDIVQRFFGEAKAVNLIGHPNIVDISDFSHLPDGRPFIIMEFLEGQSLEDHLESKGTLQTSEVLHLLKQMCSALGAAHAKHIVHRDIKPENFFITKSHDGTDFLKVLDFGIAKLKDDSADPDQLMKTEAGVVLGTPTYMSPEQAQGNTHNSDHRTDIYSLGIVLYQMLTGSPPFRGKTFAELIIKHLQQEPPDVSDTRNDLNPAWSELLKKALAKEPDDRFQSMAQLYQAALDADTPAAIVEVQPKTTRARPMFFAIPSLLLVGGLAFVLTKDSPATESAQGPTLVTTESVATESVQAAGSEPSAATPRVQATPPTENSQPGQVASIEPQPDEPKVQAIAPIDAAQQVEPQPVPTKANKKQPNKRPPKERGSGTVIVSANPWAHVYLDGKRVGQTPHRTKISAGPHKLKLKNGNTGETKTQRFHLKADRTKKIHVKW